MIWDREHHDQVIAALTRLLVLTPEEREIWVDSRIVRVSIIVLAEREGLTKQGISYRLTQIDAKLAGARTAVAA